MYYITLYYMIVTNGISHAKMTKKWGTSKWFLLYVFATQTVSFWG